MQNANAQLPMRVDVHKFSKENAKFPHGNAAANKAAYGFQVFLPAFF
jgi:hypothetical protein